MLFETEADLLLLGYVEARQPPTTYIREWETAGTAHDDTYGLLYSRRQSERRGRRPGVRVDVEPAERPDSGHRRLHPPINAGSHTYELRAAVAAINNWVRTGNPPPQSPRLDVNLSKTGFVTDANGNALGGIRTPQVAAAVSKLSGSPPVAHQRRASRWAKRPRRRARR